MSATFSTRKAGDVTVVDVSGRIVLGEPVSGLRSVLQDLIGQGDKKILLNLANVTYLDSGGIGELVAAYTSMANRGGQVKLLNLTKRLSDLLQITKLYTVFEVHEDEARALRSFSVRSASA